MALLHSVLLDQPRVFPEVPACDETGRRRGRGRGKRMDGAFKNHTQSGRQERRGNTRCGALASPGYWASYNVAFYSDIREVLGERSKMDPAGADQNRLGAGSAPMGYRGGPEGHIKALLDVTRSTFDGFWERCWLTFRVFLDPGPPKISVS